jgi:excisionase family DNA binding protein
LRSYQPRHVAALVGDDVIQLLTIGQAAERIGCSERTIRNLVQRGELRTKHIGRLLRFIDVDIEAYKLTRDGQRRR